MGAKIDPIFPKVTFTPKFKLLTGVGYTSKVYVQYTSSIAAAQNLVQKFKNSSTGIEKLKKLKRRKIVDIIK